MSVSTVGIVTIKDVCLCLPEIQLGILFYNDGHVLLFCVWGGGGGQKRQDSAAYPQPIIPVTRCQVQQCSKGIHAVIQILS